MPTILGLDIGSCTIGAVWLDGDGRTESAVLDSGVDPQQVCAELVARRAVDRVVATGYGRHAARHRFGAAIITEIKAVSLGARRLYPEAISVLDIGGQDTKAVLLSPNGQVSDFEMNDKCAAGTGKFLEVMARALGFNLTEFGAAAFGARASREKPLSISAMCTVFAESEVIGLVHRGEDRGRIAWAVHASVARRTLGLLKRVAARGPMVFAGGVAKNPAMVALVRESFGEPVLVPEHCQTVGALGAALHGSRADNPVCPAPIDS